MILAEFCPGGSLQEHLNSLGVAGNTIRKSNRDPPQFDSESCNKKFVDSPSRTAYSPEAESTWRANRKESQRRENSIDGDGDGTMPPTRTTTKAGGMVASVTAAESTPFRRLEIWVRQARFEQPTQSVCRGRIPVVANVFRAIKGVLPPLISYQDFFYLSKRNKNLPRGHYSGVRPSLVERDKLSRLVE